jgi:hypothetical protein
MRLARLAILLPWSCSEYGLGAERDDPAAGGTPMVSADPGSVDLGAVCGQAGADVTIRNEGTADLEVTDLALDGSGWALADAPERPFVLGPGEATLVRLVGSGGPGTLWVHSDDPETPELAIPLSAGQDTAPAVRIVEPLDGAVLADDADLALVAWVEDDRDDPADLAVRWESDVDGVIAEGGVLAEGMSRETWPGTNRSGGTHALTVTVTDSCGNEASATVGVCQDGAVTYDALDIGAWHYEGGAAYDGAETNLVLTEALADAVGSAFDTRARVSGAEVDIAFSVFVGGGSGADGMSLTLLDADEMSTFLGGTGCGIGYGGDASCTAGPALPGWSLELDTYFNDGVDPTDQDHLAFTFDGDVDGYRAWSALPEMEDTGWHLVEVHVTAPRLQVLVDGVAYLDQDIDGDWDFEGYVGFTAGTGSLTNRHVVDSLQVTDYACD